MKTSSSSFWKHCVGLSCLLAAFLAFNPALAEDIDIYVGNPGVSAYPNIVIAIDNSSNWSANNQGWPADTAPPVACGNDCNKQGYYELKAIRAVISGLPADAAGNLKVNLGLAMFNNSNADRDGAYIRNAVKAMTPVNKAALLAKVDTIIGNFNTETAAASVQYSAMLWDLFKYFGGFTNPLNATSNTAPPSNPLFSTIPIFGTKFWGSNDADGTKPDVAAYSGTDYVPVIDSLGACAKNYIIFIGNGFPAKDDAGPDLTPVVTKLINPVSPAASVTQFPLDTYTTSSAYGSWSDVSTCSASCAAPANTATDQYQCVATGCGVGTQKVQTRTVTTSTTWGAWGNQTCMPATACVQPANTTSTEYQCIQSSCGAGMVTLQSRTVTSGNYSAWSAYSDYSTLCQYNTAAACTTALAATPNTALAEYQCNHGTCSGNKETVERRTRTFTPTTFTAWADSSPACVATGGALPANTATTQYQWTTTGCAAGLQQLQMRTGTSTTTYGAWGDVPQCSASCVAPANTASMQYQCVQSVCSGTNKLVQSRTVSSTTTITSTVPSGNAGGRYADEMTDFLHRTDVSSVDGQQNVITYTIDVCKDQCNTDQEALMRSMAKYGGGKYCKATTYEEIRNCFESALIDILAVNSVFASASLPISATNRSQSENQVYIGMFRPDPTLRPRWLGNLKRYLIAFTSPTEIGLVDANGQPAINNQTGFVGDCVSSVWTSNPADSTAYWQTILGIDPVPVGRCTNYMMGSYSAYSDKPDGPFVEKGAVSQILRLGNNPAYYGASPNAATFSVNRSIFTLNGGATATASYTNSSIDGLHARGYDVNNERPGGSVATPADGASDARPSIHGDVVHSRPLPINFCDAADTSCTGKTAIFYGANDGLLRVVNAQTGKEVWSFVAPEFDSKLSRLTNNTPLVQFSGYTYPAAVVPAPKDYFFDGAFGLYQTLNSDAVWVYPSMRRGGRMVYGFDATTTSGSGATFVVTPSFKWRFGCDSGGICYSGSGTTVTTDADVPEIGQTWSLPSAIRIKTSASTSVVAVAFGGGYDTCEDADSATPSCGAGTKGKRVFVVDADTGEKLRAFTTLRAVPADLTFVDSDTDGYIDYAYAVDAGGNVYRIAFRDSTGPLAVANWTMTKIAYTNGSGRKFLYPPAALLNKGKVYLSFGSGDREHPLATQYPYTHTVTNPNRYYVYQDDLSVASPTAVNLDDATGVMQDLTYSSTYAGGPTCAQSDTIKAWGAKKGWFMDLRRGEQVVTATVITAGVLNFSTNLATEAAANTCASSLGKAFGWSVNLLTSSGVNGTTGLCGGNRYAEFAGGGLPPSPVVATVLIPPYGTTITDGNYTDSANNPIPNSSLVPVNVCIGCSPTSNCTGAQCGKIFNPKISGRRTRTYWHTETEKK